VYLLLVFIRRGFLRHISYKLSFSLQIVNVLMSVVSFFYLSQLIQSGNTQLLSEYGNNAAAFLIVGTTFNTWIGVSLRAVADQIQNDQSMGVLEHMLMGRIGLTRLAVYSAAYQFLWSTVVSVGTFVLLSIVFDVPFWMTPTVLVIFVLSTVGVAGLGLVSAGIIMVAKQGDPIAFTIGILAGLLSGVFYPPEILPDWLESIAYMLPTTYGLRALRHALINGAELWSVSSDAIVLVLFAVTTIPLGLLAFHLGFLKARRDGTLSHY
jgi:ABC-2 type transport system permease protein